MTDMKWEDPPPASDRKNGVNWREIAAALRASPGRWALVARLRYTTTASYISSARLADFRPAGTYEAVSRSVEVDGHRFYNIYARYIGGEE